MKEENEMSGSSSSPPLFKNSLNEQSIHCIRFRARNSLLMNPEKIAAACARSFIKPEGFALVLIKSFMSSLNGARE